MFVFFVNYEVVGFDVGLCCHVLLSCPTSDLVMALGRGEDNLAGTDQWGWLGDHGGVSCNSKERVLEV